MTADVQASTDVPLRASLEAGARVSQDWSVYGDAYVQPTLGQFGADVGARFKNNLDLYAGVTGNTSGDVGVGVGLKWTF